MIGAAELTHLGLRLGRPTGPDEPAIWDTRIDAEEASAHPNLLLHAQHQALMRAYQARYVLLPERAPCGSIVERLARRYETAAELELARRALEAQLIAPLVATARAAAAGRSCADYGAALIEEVRDQPENAFTAFLRGAPGREAHYRNFLLQSSADLLVEASASAMGVMGEFGAPQSALFRILIDEFGYGAHGKKHSVLYRHVMRDFGLSDEYNAYWPLFDTASLALHNTIHYLFQNPQNLFLQVGFLLHAETAYQRSTLDHFRYLREFHPKADARYFGEHAHIDLHHTRMIVEEVAAPLVATYGAEAGAEIVAGAEMTRLAFAQASGAMLAVSHAFEAAILEGRAAYASPTRFGRAVVPGLAGDPGRADLRVQVGGLGVVDAAAFAAFPKGALGRWMEGEA